MGADMGDQFLKYLLEVKEQSTIRLSSFRPRTVICHLKCSCYVTAVYKERSITFGKQDSAMQYIITLVLLPLRMVSNCLYWTYTQKSGGKYQLTFQRDAIWNVPEWCRGLWFMKCCLQNLSYLYSQGYCFRNCSLPIALENVLSDIVIDANSSQWSPIETLFLSGVNSAPCSLNNSTSNRSYLR